MITGGKQGYLYLLNTQQPGPYQRHQFPDPPNLDRRLRHLQHGIVEPAGGPVLYLMGAQLSLRGVSVDWGISSTRPFAKLLRLRRAVSGDDDLGQRRPARLRNPVGDDPGYLAAALRRNAARLQCGRSLLRVMEQFHQSDATALGSFSRFANPTVANGKVYVPSLSNQLLVYGHARSGHFEAGNYGPGQRRQLCGRSCRARRDYRDVRTEPRARSTRHRFVRASNSPACRSPSMAYPRRSSTCRPANWRLWCPLKSRRNRRRYR